MSENHIDINAKKCEFYKNICKHGDNCRGIYETKIGNKVDRCVRYMDSELMKQKHARGYFK